MRARSFFWVTVISCLFVAACSAGTKPGQGGDGGTGGTTGGTAGTGGTTSSGCAEGMVDCDGDAANGCEADLQYDAVNCGECGKVCEGGPDAAPICALGGCGLTCVTGKGDCNGEVADGCESDLATDPVNCGACTKDCMGVSCVAGACQCAGETQAATAVPVDLFVMLDQSGSMTQTVPSGETRWEAVTTAMKEFFADPGSATLGAGLQYFALWENPPPCPVGCQVDTDCGAYGPCTFGTCQLCQCPGCVDSCDPFDYAKAEIEIAPLDATQAAVLSDSLDKHFPSTGTPTGPALAGAIEHAKSWALANPTHKTVVVLVTDGEPSECLPLDIPDVANIAAAGYQAIPSILTFVVGVGESLANLNALAAGGGTGQAFLVGNGGNAVQELKDALTQIGYVGAGCEYAITQPMMGELDYGKVNVNYTPGNGNPPTVVPNVQSEAACDPVKGGWYYDDADMPSKIILCDTTCSAIQLDPMAQVEIQFGCDTSHLE